MPRQRLDDRGLWELLKLLAMVGGFLLILVQAGRWWGATDEQLKALSRIEQSLNEVIVPQIHDHGTRLDNLEECCARAQSDGRSSKVPSRR